jgi:hypothetical protein
MDNEQSKITATVDDIEYHFDCEPPVSDADKDNVWWLHKITIETLKTASRVEIYGKPKCKEGLTEGVKHDALNRDGSPCVVEGEDNIADETTSTTMYVALGGPYNFTFDELKENLGSAGDDADIVLYGVGNKVVIDKFDPIEWRGNVDQDRDLQTLGPDGIYDNPVYEASYDTWHYIKVAKSVETSITKDGYSGVFYSSWPERILAKVKEYRKCIAAKRVEVGGDEVTEVYPKFYQKIEGCPHSYSLDLPINASGLTNEYPGSYPTVDYCKPYPIYHREEEKWFFHFFDDFGFDRNSNWKPTGGSSGESRALRYVISDSDPTNYSLFHRWQAQTFWGCYSTDVDYDADTMTCGTVEIWGDTQIFDQLYKKGDDRPSYDRDKYDWEAKTAESRCKLDFICSPLPLPAAACITGWCTDVKHQLIGDGQWKSSEAQVVQGHCTSEHIDFETCKADCSPCIQCDETQSQINDSDPVTTSTLTEECCESESSTGVIYEFEKCPNAPNYSTGASHLYILSETDLSSHETFEDNGVCYEYIQSYPREQAPPELQPSEYSGQTLSSCDCESPTVGGDPHVTTFFGEKYDM